MRVRTMSSITPSYREVVRFFFTASLDKDTRPCMCVGCRVSGMRYIHSYQVDQVGGDGAKHLAKNGERLRGHDLILYIVRQVPAGRDICRTRSQSLPLHTISASGGGFLV